MVDRTSTGDTSTYVLVLTNVPLQDIVRSIPSNFLTHQQNKVRVAHKFSCSNQTTTTTTKKQEQDLTMTIESILERELSICYIDARNILTTAKLNLGIYGYESPGQREALIQEAQKIFFSTSIHEQESMQEKHENMEHTIRNLTGCTTTGVISRNGDGSGMDSWENTFDSSTRSSNSAISVSSSYGTSLLFGRSSRRRRSSSSTVATTSRPHNKHHQVSLH